jgi:hypothetical protein
MHHWAGVRAPLVFCLNVKKAGWGSQKRVGVSLELDKNGRKWGILHHELKLKHLHNFTIFWFKSGSEHLTDKIFVQSDSWQQGAKNENTNSAISTLTNDWIISKFLS